MELIQTLQTTMDWISAWGGAWSYWWVSLFSTLSFIVFIISIAVSRNAYLTNRHSNARLWAVGAVVSFAILNVGGAYKYRADNTFLFHDRPCSATMMLLEPGACN